ncbi:MAG: ATP-binding protein, partial [Candidatus Solibacter sp.]
GDRAASLTQQLLAFSRKQLLKTAVVNINQSVAEVNTMLRRLIGEQIKLVTRLSADLGNIKADAGQLQQIIVNLVVNGRDAMPDGGTLIIETKNVAFDDSDLNGHPERRLGRHVMLAIMDDGLGMAPHVEERIFEPFFTTKPKGLGTGLGLAMVHGIVMQSGGWIRVASEPGQGTAFRIYFPRTDDPIVLLKQSIRAHVQGTETVLVVEDQEEVRNLAAVVLRACGYTVHVCAHGEEALGFVAAFRGAIHLLISDVIMPGIDGMALAKILAEQRPGLRSILMSGYTDKAVTQDAMADGKIAYLQKPFTPGQLAEKAREVLSTQPDSPEWSTKRK